MSPVALFLVNVAAIVVCISLTTIRVCSKPTPELDPFYVEAMRELDILDGTVLPELPAAPAPVVPCRTVNEWRRLTNAEVSHLLEEWCLNEVTYNKNSFGRNYAYKKSL